MNVTCPSCAARYTADEQKLRGKTARMRCRHCDTVWLVSGPSLEAEEPATAARVRRGSDRDQRDLFAPQPVDPGMVRQTLRPPPPADETVPPPSRHAASGTAARNETSVLFTLADLSGGARLKTPEPERTPMAQTTSRAEDDEGIIDLKALASVPPRAGVRPVAPLFSEPPPAAFSVDAEASDVRPAVQPQKSTGKRIATIFAAVAAIAVAGVGLAYAFKTEKPAPVAALAPPAPPPPPAVVAPPPPAPAPDPAPAASSASSDDAKATTGKKGKGGKGAKGGKAAKASTEAAAKPAAPPKPAPAADPCGCKGDFNCVLACTVKKGK